jgi:hypothetical protein
MEPDQAEAERVWYEGSCHCRAIRFAAAATRNLTITVCNCSICSMSGHQELMVPEERFRLHCGAEFLTTYQYGTRISRHTFCRICGIKPFYRPRSHPVGYFSVNARCLDLSQAEHIEYVQFDGQNWEESIAAGLHVITE